MLFRSRLAADVWANGYATEGARAVREWAHSDLGLAELVSFTTAENWPSRRVMERIGLTPEGYTLDDLRNTVVELRVDGLDQFVLEGASSVAEISRDLTDLVAQTISRHHQYPDGVCLYSGTMFAPIKDRSKPGQGFTHALGDTVTIRAERLGALINRVVHTDKAPPWTFGASALMRNLAKRGLLT